MQRAPACPPDQQVCELALVEFGRLHGGADCRLSARQGEGVIPHFAIYVDDVDKAAADLRAAGRGHLP